MPPWFHFEKRSLGWICLGILASYSLAGFWPFDFQTRNNARLLPDASGLQFERHGHALSREPLVIDSGSKPGAPGAFSIELLLEADAKQDRDYPIILSLYDGRLPENIVIGQWKSGVFLRAATDDPSIRRHYWEVGAGTVLKQGQRALLAIVSDVSGTAIFRDGMLIRRQPKRFSRQENLRGSLILGNSATGSGGTWKGKLFGLAFLNRALGPAEAAERYGLWKSDARENLALAPGTAGIYFFDGGSGEALRDRAGKGPEIVLPDRFRVPRKAVLAFSNEDPSPQRWNVEDIAVNIVGFIPFGLFFSLYLQKVRPMGKVGAAALVIAAGAAVSLSIELVQIYLPSRDSSLTDMFNNVLGTFVGIVFANFKRKGAENAKV